LQDETGGDISSFVTNGEWDLLGKRYILFLNLVNLPFHSNKKKLQRKTLQVPTKKCETLSEQIIRALGV
jgi:hypothetical protein